MGHSIGSHQAVGRFEGGPVSAHLARQTALGIGGHLSRHPHARAEFVGKGILVTLGRFSTDARDTAKGAPVDLLDGDDLAKLMRKHLPQSYATRKV